MTPLLPVKKYARFSESSGTLTCSYERPLVPGMIHINSPRTTAAYSFKIYSKFLPSSPRSFKRPFSPQVLQTKTCCPTRATCPVHLIVLLFTTLIISGKSIPVAARSKAWVCSRSLDGIVGSNPAGGIDVCLI